MDFLERLRTRAAARRQGRYLGGRIGKSLCFIQGDQNIANQAGAAFRADLNTELQALVTNNQGNSAPGTTYRNQTWHDTTANVKKRRNAANSAWIAEGTLDESFVLSRSSNTILGVSDVGKAIVATANFTQTLTAAATLGDGWWVEYRNDGTGIITIDPNGAETIDGATTITLNPGDSCIIVCNGAAFKTVGRQASLTRPSFSAYVNAATSMTQNTFVKMQFGTEDFDTNNNYDNATNYRFTPTVPGKYLVTVLATLGVLSNTKSFVAALYKNGALYKQGMAHLNNTGGNVEGVGMVTALIDMNGSTDYVEAFGFNTDVAQTLSTTQAKSHFSAYKVDA